MNARTRRMHRITRRTADRCAAYAGRPRRPVPAVLVVVGGPQYRVGSHRQFVLLARALSGRGIPVLRLDLAGMGDSGGEFRGFEHSAPDIRAAIDLLQHHEPQVREVCLWGLCDGASAALMYACQDPRVTQLVLLNPWVRTTEGQAQAYLDAYYGRKLRSLGFWRRMFFHPAAIPRAASGYLSNVRSARRTPSRGRMSIRSLPRPHARGRGGFPWPDPGPVERAGPGCNRIRASARSFRRLAHGVRFAARPDSQAPGGDTHLLAASVARLGSVSDGSLRRMLLPTFIEIGAQRAGTTWAYNCLAQHPEVYMSEKKELHFFYANYSRGLAWYAEQFAPPVTPRARRDQPRLHVQTRDPGPQRPRPARRASVRDPPQSRRPRNLGLCVAPGTQRGDELLRGLPALPGSDRPRPVLQPPRRSPQYFPAERVKILLYDDLVSRPGTFLDELYGFIGVRTGVRPVAMGTRYNRVIYPGLQKALLGRDSAG